MINRERNDIPEASWVPCRDVSEPKPGLTKPPVDYPDEME